MHKKNTRDDTTVNQETLFPKENELEMKDGQRSTCKSESGEGSPNSATLEAGKDHVPEKKTNTEYELALNKLSRVAVSSKPGGAWAAGPPSSMMQETNLERSQTTLQHNHPHVEVKGAFIEEPTVDTKEIPQPVKAKQEIGQQKNRSQTKGNAKSSPDSSSCKETTPNDTAFTEKETVNCGSSLHSKGGMVSSSWPPPGTLGQPFPAGWPGSVPNSAVLDSQKYERNDDLKNRQGKKGDMSSSAEVSNDSMRNSPHIPNGYQSIQYPFYSYPSPYMPMQNFFVPPWLLYPYAAPLAVPRAPNVVGGYASTAHDEQRERESNNVTNNKDHSNSYNPYRGNPSNIESTTDSHREKRQQRAVTENNSKTTAGENPSAHNGLEKSPKRNSITNGKNATSPLVSSPSSFAGFHGSFEKNQSMAAFYSPWPMMMPPLVWFPDPRMIDPYQTVTETAVYVYQRIRPTRDESIRKASLFRHLYKLCQNEWKHCDLWMFGSSINSFGLRSGDLDMCLTVPSEDAIHRVTGERLEERHIVNRLGVILRQAKMENVECRFRARVPIVKFHDPLTRLSVDVCINNKLARHNSALLRTYASLDPRVQILGLLIKYWAKCRGINQPFTGTLSSYAYILLLIQFLQVRSRPLLPCLQQSVGGEVCTVEDSIPKVFVDNCNVYFDTCVTGYISTLSSLNSESIGSLLTDFFGFYAYTFDYPKQVVSIRSGRLLTREEKNWFIPPVDARIEESDEEEEHVNLDSHIYTTSPVEAHTDIFPHDMNPIQREPTSSKVGEVSDGEENKQSSSSVLSPKMPVMNILRMPKKQKRFKELHVFCIEDPFDTSHDIGRVVDEDSLEVLREEFIRAYEIIRTTGNFLEVCRPYEAERPS